MSPREKDLFKTIDAIKTRISGRICFIKKRIELKGREEDADIAQLAILRNELEYLQQLARDYFPTLLLSEEDRKRRTEQIGQLLKRITEK